MRTVNANRMTTACTMRASTARPSSATSSGSPAPPSTGRSNVTPSGQRKPARQGQPAVTGSGSCRGTMTTNDHGTGTHSTAELRMLMPRRAGDYGSDNSGEMATCQTE